MSKDFFGNDVDLSQKKLWLFDMDGTIYEEETLFDGTLDLLAKISLLGGHYVLSRTIHQSRLSIT